MASGQQKLVVVVVGDTTQFEKSLTRAAGKADAFGRKVGSNGGAVSELLKMAKQSGETARGVEKWRAETEKATAANEAAARSMGRATAAGLALGFGINVAARNFEQLGGEAGRAGKAINQLTTGNFVGFYKTVTDNSKAVDDFTKKLVAQGDSAIASRQANMFAAEGFDEVAKAARNAAKQLEAAELAARKPIPFSAIASGTFGITPLDNLLGKQDQAQRRRGITAGQRNQWFDAGIARQLDRVQDVTSLSGQVRALDTIAGLIEQRIGLTKDITRKLNLEDELLRVRRQRKSVVEEIAEREAEAAKKAKAAADKMYALFLAASQARRKAFAVAAGGPQTEALTKTTALNANPILAGLGLSPGEERELRSRLSRFNSAGVALAGPSRGASASITIKAPDVYLDGAKVSASTRSHNTIHARQNPKQKRGSR